MRRGLDNRLDTVARHVDGGRYANAANVLESVRNRIDNHVREGYDTTPSHIYGKDTLVEMVTYRIERFESLSERDETNDGDSSGRGRGNGQGRGGGRSH